MVENDNLRYTKMALNNGSGAIPALGFGTLSFSPAPSADDFWGFVTAGTPERIAELFTIADIDGSHGLNFGLLRRSRP